MAGCSGCGAVQALVGVATQPHVVADNVQHTNHLQRGTSMQMHWLRKTSVQVFGGCFEMCQGAEGNGVLPVYVTMEQHMCVTSCPGTCQ